MTLTEALKALEPMRPHGKASSYYDVALVGFIDRASYDRLKRIAILLAEASAYVISKKHFIGTPKWDAEFVDVCEKAQAEALKILEEVSGE